jgi:hypothetical protein
MIQLFFLLCLLTSFAATGQSFRKHEPVEIAAKDGKVYNATILDVKDGKYLVHYDGFNSTDDVWLTADLIQKAAKVGATAEMYATDGKWYRGRLMEIANNRFRFRLDNYAAAADQWITREQFRTLAAEESTALRQPEPKPAGSFERGTKIEILWGGKWYPGNVTERRGEEIKVHYEGWADSWDEWVKRDRVRLPGASAGTGQPTTPGIKPKEEITTVKQSYSGTAGRLYLRTYGYTMNGRYSLNIDWVFLGNDGTIVFNPVGGVDPIDYKTEAEQNTKNIGKYTLNGSTLHITWRTGKTDKWSTEKKGGEFSSIDGGIVSRQAKMPAGYRLAGQFAATAVTANLGSVSTFQFRKDGSFTLESIGTVSTPDVTGKKEWSNGGTYSITGNTLTLRFNDGKVTKSVVCLWDGAGERSLVINRRYFPEEKLK